MACVVFLHQGLNWCPLHWQANPQPLVYQGNPVSSVWLGLNGLFLHHFCRERRGTVLPLLLGDWSPESPFGLFDTWRSGASPSAGQTWSPLTLQGMGKSLMTGLWELASLPYPSVGCLVTVSWSWKSRFPSWPLLVWVWVAPQFFSGHLAGTECLFFIFIFFVIIKVLFAIYFVMIKCTSYNI